MCDLSELAHFSCSAVFGLMAAERLKEVCEHVEYSGGSVMCITHTDIVLLLCVAVMQCCPLFTVCV